MSDLIDRKAAIDLLKSWSGGFDYIETETESAIKDFQQLPSVQPEIIRCKDCKHRYIEDMIWHCPFGLMGGEDFFCGYAERRIENDQTQAHE